MCVQINKLIFVKIKCNPPFSFIFFTGKSAPDMKRDKKEKLLNCQKKDTMNA